MLPLFATAYLVYHTQFRLSRGFLNFFQVFFDIFVRSKSQFLASSCALPVSLASRAPAPLRSFIILPLSSPFVNPFFIFFSPFFLFLTLSFRRFELFIPFFSVFWGFVGFCRKGWLRCDDSKHAKPRNFLHRKRVYSFRLYEKNQKYTRGLRTSGLQERFKSPVYSIWIGFPAFIR